MLFFIIVEIYGKIVGKIDGMNDLSVLLNLIDIFVFVELDVINM